MRDKTLYRKLGFFSIAVEPSTEVKAKNSYVYFAKIGDKVKIGTTGNVKARVQCISTNTPEKVEILLVIDGDRKLEKILHSGFCKSKHKGEWFNYTDEIKDYIKMSVKV